MTKDMKCNHKLSPQYSRDELHRIIHYCEKCDVKCFAFNKDNSPIWEDEKSQTYISISLIKEALGEEEKLPKVFVFKENSLPEYDVFEKVVKTGSNHRRTDIINFLKNKGYEI